MVTPAARRRAAGHLIETRAISERRACRSLQLHRSVARYQSRRRSNDEALRQRLQELAQRYPRYGYLMLNQFLRREGLVVNRKRTYRIYCELGLQVRTKRRKKLQRPRLPMLVPARPK
jgi:putative transposase